MRKFLLSQEPNLRQMFSDGDCCKLRLNRDQRLLEILFGRRSDGGGGRRRFTYMTTTMLGSRMERLAHSHAGSLIVVEAGEGQAARDLAFPVTKDKE